MSRLASEIELRLCHQRGRFCRGQTNLTTLFKLGQRHFQEMVSQLRDDGFSVDPNLKLRARNGWLCHYDSATQTIFLTMPDRDSKQGRLQMMLLRSLFDCDSDSEVIAFLSHVLRWLIAHEIAHHCRHQLGNLSKNIWQEDQIANYLAIALSKPHFSVADKAWCDAFLRRAIQNLAKKSGGNSSVIDTYHSLPHSFFVANLIDIQTLEQIAKVKKQTGHLCENILKHKLVNNLPSDVVQRVDNRHQLIKHINAGDYQSVLLHAYYYFGWMHIGLMSLEHYTTQDFSDRFLDGDHAYAQSEA